MVYRATGKYDEGELRDWVKTQDPAKALSNLAKHGVSFDQAATVLLDPLALTVFDAEHSQADNHDAEGKPRRRAGPREPSSPGRLDRGEAPAPESRNPAELGTALRFGAFYAVIRRA